MKKILAILVLLLFVGFLINNFIFAMQEVNSKADLRFSKSPLTLSKSNPEDSIRVSEKKINPSDSIKPNNNPGLTQNKLDSILHYATWYHTIGTSVHRSHPTAAYNNLPKGTKLKVTNVKNGDTCIVEVTDVMGCRLKCWKGTGYKCAFHSNKIDLSHSAFGSISEHGRGKIIVSVKPLID